MTLQAFACLFVRRFYRWMDMTDYNNEMQRRYDKSFGKWN